MNIDTQGLAGLAVVSLLVAGCALGRGGPQQVQGNGDGTQTQLTVVNGNWADIAVFALRDGIAVRLGTVQGNSRRTFPIPASAQRSSGTVELRASPMGSRESLETGPILVNRGAVIQWNLEHRLRLSTYAVHSGP